MSPRLRIALAIAAAALPAARPALAACEPGPEVVVAGLGTPDDDLLRMAQLVGAAPVAPEIGRRGGARLVRLCAGAEPFGWTPRLAAAPAARNALVVLPARVDSTWNASYPAAANDGLLWAGRGFSVLGSAGAYARLGPVSLALAPEVAWQQNAWLEIVPTGQSGDLAFENPWYRDDYDVPQRFGAGPFARASPGQSFLRVDAFGVALGVSTESRWLGPGLRNAILLTDAGPGFPHLFLGTSAPVGIGIGKLDVLALWGQLSRSRYGRDQGAPWFTALALTWEPRWTPGFFVGAGRAFVESWESLRGDGFLTVVEPPWKPRVPGGDNPEDNQVASIWFRWVLPESRLELYGEWAKDDFPASVGALVREAESRHAWVLGLQKLSRVGARWLRLQLELASTYDGGGDVAEQYVFYGHFLGLGYTHAGQPLGSAIGPGGVFAGAALDVLGAGGRTGFFVERLERNADVFFRTVAKVPGRSTDRDTEIVAGVRQVLHAAGLELSWEIAGGYRWNRDFIRNEPSARVSLSVATAPRTVVP